MTIHLTNAQTAILRLVIQRPLVTPANRKPVQALIAQGLAEFIKGDGDWTQKLCPTEAGRKLMGEIES